MNTTSTLSCFFTSGIWRFYCWGVVALALVLTALPAMAKLSNPTGGRINGQAPTVTGTLKIYPPGGGTTELTNNAEFYLDAIPNKFTLSSVASSGMAYADADGDKFLSTPGFTQKTVTWTWTKPSGGVIAADQLGKPFSQLGLANGDKVTVKAVTLFDVTSATGLPKINQNFQSSTKTYTVVMKTAPVIWVNGQTFGINEGFPKTGFSGAKFQFYMNGVNANNNGDYTYSIDQNWAYISNLADDKGTVYFQGISTSATKRVTITITGPNQVKLPPYTFTINRWFVNSYTMTSKANNAVNWCINNTDGYTLPVFDNVSTIPAARASNGKLWSEWGNLSYHGYYNTGWVDGSYPLNETPSVGRVSGFNAMNGANSLLTGTNSYRVSCSKEL